MPLIYIWHHLNFTTEFVKSESTKLENLLTSLYCISFCQKAKRLRFQVAQTHIQSVQRTGSISKSAAAFLESAIAQTVIKSSKQVCAVGIRSESALNTR